FEPLPDMGNSLYTVPEDSTDRSRSGVIRFEVEDWMVDYDGRNSPEVEVGGVPWKANVRKLKGKSGEQVAVYLCSEINRSMQWSIDVDFEIILFNSDSSKNVTTKRKTITFHNDRRIWGEHE
ncbi:hypothetical protein PMAYCL1PPCAC_24937, partial [Pristionchus mayeri]